MVFNDLEISIFLHFIVISNLDGSLAIYCVLVSKVKLQNGLSILCKGGSKPVVRLPLRSIHNVLGGT